MIHVHVGQNDVCYRRKVDAGGLQSPDQLPGSWQVQVRIGAQPGVDQNGLAAAPHHDRIQRPIECVLRQIHLLEPGSSCIWICIVT